MLIVGDIHATRKIIQPCINRIQQLVDHYPDEEVILFVGDYVYHFSYDARALHTLFSYRVELVKQGKQVIVLAGNHDWIHNQFVYAEGKLAFEMIQGNHPSGSIDFVTQPHIKTIQGQDVLLFPYTTSFEQESSRIEYQDLIASSHSKERLSGIANSLLHDMIDDRKVYASNQEKLLLIHHWYTAGISFPGQFAKFTYASPAISNHWLDDDRLMIMSGHLHQPFIKKNYCCVGSLRHTSPLEINQQKFIFALDTTTRSLTCSPVAVNPFYQATPEDLLEGIDTFVETTQQISRSYMESDLWKITYNPMLGTFPYDSTTLTILSDSPECIELLDTHIQQTIGTIRQKQSFETLNSLISSMQESSKDLDKNFSDWKSLLKEFLSAKYGDRKSHYIEDLNRLQIL